MDATRALNVLVWLTTALMFVLHSPPSTAAADQAELSRADFPQGFVFGTSSSAYQYEGAAQEDGRGPSIWDTFSVDTGNVGNDDGNVATDEYHRYKEDISLMSEIGMDAYRFSISWSRIYPEGKGQVNTMGLQYYNNLIDGLLEKGIKPYVTLYHWDLPQALEDAYGGWLSPLIIQEYAHYVDTCFKHFGDRVKNWMTFNEPATFIVFGYNSGLYPPQRCSRWVANCTDGDSAVEPYKVAHNVLLSHAAAAHIYRTKYQKHQKGKIGIAIDSRWYIPLSESREDLKAVHRLHDFTLGWYLEPLLSGHYPAIMRKIVGDRLPIFTQDQQEKLVRSIDFLGVNYYTANYVAATYSSPNPNKTDFYLDTMTTTTGERNGVPIGPQAGSSWLYIYPSGIYHLMKYIKQRYKMAQPIYITENGVDEVNNASLTLQQALKDPLRIKYHKEHLRNLAKSIKEGVDVHGYFAWSLLDNFEWTSGYNVRFGLHFVDFNTLKRYPKNSAKWFKRVLRYLTTNDSTYVDKLK